MLTAIPDLTATAPQKPLKRETDEMEELHVGLRRQLSAWRAHHEQTTAHAARVIARIDGLLDKARALSARNTPPTS